MIASPRLIVCDEPTLSLDGGDGAKVLELLREVGLRDNPRVLVVSHDAHIDQVRRSDAEMSDGQIVSTRSARTEEGASHA